MKVRTGIETAVVAVCSVLIVVSVVVGAEKLNASYIIPLVAIPVIVWLLTPGRRATRNEITGGEEYRALADEYRRLADLAITAQEHTDLKLGEVSVRMDYLREQMESLQKILKEVE